MKILIYLFFISTFLLPSFVFSQQELTKQMNLVLNSTSSDKIIDKNQKIEKLKQLFVKFKKYSHTPETGILYTELALIEYGIDEKEKAKSHLLKSISILNKYKKTHLEALNRSRNNLSWFYYYNGRINEQYSLLKQIISDKGKDEFTIDAIINSSIIESNKGDYYSGLNRLNTLLAETNDKKLDVKIRASIVSIFSKMYESNSSIKTKSNLDIIKKHHSVIDANFYQTDLDESQLFSTYNNLANIYDTFGDLNVSLQLYLKAKNYYLKNNEKSSRLDVTNNIGYLYSKLKKEKLAVQFYNEVINQSDDVYQIATAYNNLGYFLNVKSSEKIHYLQKAIQIILENNNSTFTLPSLDLIKESGYQQEVLVYLVDLSDLYVKAYKETNDKTFLLNAKKSLYLIDELVSLIRYESNTEQSKLFWIEKGVNTYMLATEVCYLLNKPTEAFYFIEKNKALLLQENIKNFQAKLELQIPNEVLEREYKLHYELISLEKWFQKNPKNATIKLKFRTKSKEFQVHTDLIKWKYPKYSKLKENIDILTIEKAISNLTKDQCFITYILNQNDGYGIFCNSQEKIFFKIDNVISFQKRLKTLKVYMTQNLLDKNKTIAFKNLGYSVFKSLFPFPNALEKIKGKKILIIPDDSILNLPFEALPINTTKSLADSYLINYTEISYLQSFSVFEKIKQKNSKPSKKLLAIAPYQFEDKSLPELISSKEAINDLKKFSGSTIFIEEKATKENFYSNCQDYEIVHLNTHAGIDSITDSPWISFRKNKLTLDELYGINNNSELVILDACKTNDGTVASGEGILSLTRGFFNNGAKSVLASLWNVNEKAGNEIMASFYSELKAGKSKSKAIQLAKIKYLKVHKNTEALPYYWASFTLTGSTKPIELSESYFQGTPLLIIIASLSLLLFFIYKGRKHFISK